MGITFMKTEKVVAAFLKSAESRGLSIRTISWYCGILLKFCEKYSRLPSAPEDCETFILSCTAGDERRHGYYRALGALYNYTEKRWKLKTNPMRRVDAPRRTKKLPRPISPEQLYQLLSFPHAARITAALYFLADTGSRLSEMLGLNHTSFFETEWGTMATITGKTGARMVPISREAFIRIVEVIPFNISPGRMSRLLSQAFKDARVPGTAHSLRHTFGTLWEGDDDALQRIMGHAQFSTTQIYRQVRIRFLTEQHARYSPLKKVLPMTRNMI